MSDFHRGDIVSLSRAQSILVSVLIDPQIPDDVYTIALPINGTSTDFSYVGQPGESINDVAAGLLAVLLNEQTVYSAALGASPWTIVVVGDLGSSFGVSVTANLQADLVEASVLAVDTRTGLPIGPIRVLDPTDTLERLREYVTRDADGNLLSRNLVRGRELDSSNVFDFDASQILTVIHSEGQ